MLLSAVVFFEQVPAPVNAILSMVLSALIGIAIENIKHYREAKRKMFEDNQVKEDTVIAALKALLHNALEEHCATAEERGYITYDEVETINNIYEPYHALHGNGSGTDFHDRALRLPHKRSNQNEEKTDIA